MDLNAILTDPIFIIIAALLLLALLTLHCFKTELHYLNNEIARTEGAEREYYMKKKRKLWLSLIPFVKY